MRASWFLSAVMIAAVAGCGAASDDADDPTTSADEIASSAWTDVLGSYTADGTDGEFSTIVLEGSADHSGHHYFSESLASLVSCHVGSGCTTTHTRVDGWYTAGPRTITIHPESGASQRFTYTLSGSRLVLTRAGVAAHYTRATSYCDEAADCAEEGLIHPACAAGPTGGWHCTAHACGFSCAGPGGTTGQGAGQTCAGIAGLQCATGLTCVMPAGPSYPDQAGTCRRVSGVGGPCGGFIANAPVCAAGLTCSHTGINPDLPGVCRR